MKLGIQPVVIFVPSSGHATRIRFDRIEQEQAIQRQACCGILYLGRAVLFRFQILCCRTLIIGHLLLNHIGEPRRLPLMHQLRRASQLIYLLLVAYGSTACSSTDGGGGDDPDRGDNNELCESDVDCDNGDSCDGKETCSAGQCSNGTVVECAKNEICDSTSGECVLDCDHDGDGSTGVDCGGDDCDDEDPNRYPGNIEACTDQDGALLEDAALRDEDCDPSTLGSDHDGDRFYDSRCANEDNTSELVYGADCDDKNDLRRPGFQEICDGYDNDCNGLLDFSGEDDDEDGYADCADLVNTGRFDCNDEDPTVNPGVKEDICDGVDADCDGDVEDADEDGFISMESACVLVGDVAKNDCDDSDARLGCHTLGSNSRVECESSCDVTCDEGFGECDGILKNGCEANLVLSSQNCGACGNTCDWGCSNGACREVKQVSAGRNTTCVILSDGKVACWGKDSEGAIGDGPTDLGTDQLLPAIVFGTPGRRAEQISVSDAGTTCVLASDHTAWCWGHNDEGQAGVSQGTNTIDFPTQIEGASDFIQIEAGATFSCALDSDNTVWCWGDNTDDVMSVDTGKYDEATSPVKLVDAVTAGKVEQIAVGDSHACTLLADKHVACWGTGSEGRTGVGDSPPAVVSTPTRVKTGVINKNATAVFVSRRRSCAVLDSGQVACWGTDISGSQGDGSTSNEANFEPTLVQGIPNTERVVTMAFERSTTCALTELDRLYCWGDGLLAEGVFSSSTALEVVIPAFADGIVTYASGNDHSCALLKDGELLCWGPNDDGQLGNGEASISYSGPGPVQADVTGIVNIELTLETMCALTDDGVVRCWGGNDEGQLGTGSDSSVAVSDPHAALPVNLSGPAFKLSSGSGAFCATLMDASVECWGYNWYQTLGVVGGEDLGDAVLSPVQLNNSRLSGYVVDLELKVTPNSAILSTGQLATWGRDTSGSLGNGPDNTDDVYVPTIVESSVLDNDVVDVSSTCALTTNGAAACWGAAARLGNGEGVAGEDAHSPELVDIASLTSPLVALDSNYYGRCGLTEAGDVVCWGSLLGDTGIEEVASPLLVSSALFEGKTERLMSSGQRACAWYGESTKRAPSESVLVWIFKIITTSPSQ